MKKLTYTYIIVNTKNIAKTKIRKKIGGQKKRGVLSLKNKKEFNELRPYEKLEMYGESSLKTVELLAIIIKTGTKEKNAIEVAKEILNLGINEKNLSFLTEITIEDLKKIEGIGRVKAIQIKAMIELSKRIYKSQITEKVKVRSTNDIIELFMEEMRYEKQEVLKSIILNCKNEIIRVQEICRGNTSSVMFDIKTVLKEPVKLGAQRIILLHNHPSGDPTPSQEDIQSTNNIKEAAKLLGIELLEHIVIGNGIYTNIR